MSRHIEGEITAIRFLHWRYLLVVVVLFILNRDKNNTKKKKTPTKLVVRLC